VRASTQGPSAVDWCGRGGSCGRRGLVANLELRVRRRALYARGSSVFRPRRWVSSTESKPPPRRDGEDVEPIRMSSGAGPRAGFGVGFKMGAPAPFSLRRRNRRRCRAQLWRMTPYERFLLQDQTFSRTADQMLYIQYVVTKNLQRYKIRGCDSASILSRTPAGRTPRSRTPFQPKTWTIWARFRKSLPVVTAHFPPSAAKPTPTTAWWARSSSSEPFCGPTVAAGSLLRHSGARASARETVVMDSGPAPTPSRL
jgi:hypothetical protein